MLHVGFGSLAAGGGTVPDPEGGSNPCKSMEVKDLKTGGRGGLFS